MKTIAFPHQGRGFVGAFIQGKSPFQLASWGKAKDEKILSFNKKQVQRWFKAGFATLRTNFLFLWH